MWALIEYAARVKPQIVIFESVPLAYTQGTVLMQQLRAKLEGLTGQAWTLTHVLHNAYSVGGPAMRKRYFWVASRVPFGIEIVPPKQVPLFHEVIDDLIAQPESWAPEPYQGTPTWYSSRFWSSTGTVDGHMIVDNPNTRRTQQLLLEAEWQPGEHTQAVTRRFYEQHGKLPSQWEHNTDKLVKNDFFQGYSTPTMWKPTNPARVVTGAGLLNGVHYALPRTFTHREVARIMGFPDDWQISTIKNSPSALSMTWGKGITVDCGRWIARWAQRSLEGYPGTHIGEQVGETEYLINITNLWQQAGCATVSSSAPKLNVQRTIVPREAPVVSEDAVETVETADTPKSHGRPRPDETKNRDEVVFAAIAGSERAVTREEIATGTGLASNLVYLSLYRLNKSGRIKRDRAAGAHVWAAASVPTPVE
jgi:site-specific DNA-cytosine methylase